MSSVGKMEQYEQPLHPFCPSETSYLPCYFSLRPDELLSEIIEKENILRILFNTITRRSANKQCLLMMSSQKYVDMIIE